MSAAFHIKIITPTKVTFDGEAIHVRAPGADGYYGVLANHAALVSALDYGVLCVRHEGGQETNYAVGCGFVEVLNNKMVVIADFADETKDIDVERAKESMRRSVERLKKRHEVDVQRAESSLARARIRLIAAGHLDHPVD